MVLLPALNQFKKTHPDIHIRILNHLTTQAIESVKNGVVDFSVVVTPPIIEKNLIAYPIMQFHDMLIGGTSFAPYKNRVFSIKELISYPLVCLGEGTMTYHFYQNFNTYVYIGYNAFFLYTTVIAIVKTPSKCTFGATSIIILEAYMSAPSIPNTAVSLTVSFITSLL